MHYQPYEKANQSIAERSLLPSKIGKAAIGAAAGFAGAAVINKIAPFLSEYLPFDLAAKGLSKVSPRLGNFINKNIADGYTEDETMDYVREKVGEEQDAEQQKRQGKEELGENIIERFSPKLSAFVDKLIKEGHPIDEAIGIATSPEHKFSKAIAHMENTLGMTFYDIIRSIYGGQKRGQRQQPKQQQPQQSNPSQNAQQGAGSQKLMGALEKLGQIMGKK